MVQIEGKYQLIKNENFVEFLTALGPELPQELAKKIDGFKSVAVTVKIEGNKFTLTTESVNTSVVSFTLGEEFDEEILKGTKLKTIASLEGNVLTLSGKGSDGRSGNRIYEFSDSGLVITYTSDKTSVVAKRTYDRV